MLKVYGQETAMHFKLNRRLSLAQDKNCEKPAKVLGVDYLKKGNKNTFALAYAYISVEYL